MTDDAKPDDAVLHRLRALLSFYTSVPEEKLGPGSTPENTEGWDSVANLWLLAAVEEEFNVTIGTRDAIQLRSLAKIALYVGNKGGVAAKASGDGE
jgi:acyl carrier protein